MSNVANTTAAIEAHLDIRSMSRKRVQKDFWLVLKSPDYVNWRVSTHKLQGYIDIVVSTTCSISRRHNKTHFVMYRYLVIIEIKADVSDVVRCQIIIE